MGRGHWSDCSPAGDFLDGGWARAGLSHRCVCGQRSSEPLGDSDGQRSFELRKRGAWGRYRNESESVSDRDAAGDSPDRQSAGRDAVLVAADRCVRGDRGRAGGSWFIWSAGDRGAPTYRRDWSTDGPGRGAGKNLPTCGGTGVPPQRDRNWYRVGRGIRANAHDACHAGGSQCDRSGDLWRDCNFVLTHRSGIVMAAGAKGGGAGAFAGAAGGVDGVYTWPWHFVVASRAGNAQDRSMNAMAVSRQL